MIKYLLKEKIREYKKKNTRTDVYIATEMGMNAQAFHYKINKKKYTPDQLLPFAEFLECNVSDLYTRIENNEEMENHG